MRLQRTITHGASYNRIPHSVRVQLVSSSGSALPIHGYILYFKTPLDACQGLSKSMQMISQLRHVLDQHHGSVTCREGYHVGSSLWRASDTWSADESRVTGSSQGIGREIAVECAKHGARVVLHHIGDKQSEQDVNELISELNATSQSGEGPTAVQIGLDVTRPEAGPRYIDTCLSLFMEGHGAD